MTVTTTTSAGSGRAARPTLLPGLHRLWRGRRSLQLGTDPARAVVVELPDAGAARLLDLLDGSRSERAVLAEAGRHEIAEADARALLESLRAAGLVVAAQTLVPHNLPDPARRRLTGEAAALALRGAGAPATPAEILRRRAAARVVVTGRGPLAAPIALALAQAGVGHVWPATAGPVPAGQATAAEEDLAGAIIRTAPGTRTGRLRRREATFVVQVGMNRPANLVAAGYARLAHLAVAVRDGAAVIGPLVPPAGSPCLNCLDLHRRDRDPAWPALAAQLATTPPPGGEPCAVATVLSAAGLAAGEVLSWLDGRAPTTLGASVEITSPGRPRRRSWPPHPGCHCVCRSASDRDRRRGCEPRPPAGHGSGTRRPGAAQ
jgi:bacteriocin biosynthesis cyclodehydratase domain-containing protein